MIKKVLYSLLIFVSILFVSYEVSATVDNTNTVYFDLEHSNFTSTYDSIKSKSDEVLDYLKNNNPNNYRWVLYFGKDSTGSFLMVNLLPSNFNLLDNSGHYCFISARSTSSLSFVLGGCNSSSTATKKYIFRSDTDLSQFKEDLLLSYNSISDKMAGTQYYEFQVNKFSFSNKEYNYFSNNTKFILPYASTEKVVGYDWYMTSYKLKIGETELAIDSNSYLEPSDNYFGKNYEEFSLSSITYSAIEVKFNINDFSMVDEGNDINLEYEINLQNEMMIPLLPIPQEKIYRTLAPEEYTIGTTVNLLFDEKSNSYSYEGTNHYDYWNTITYRFEFPFSGDYVGNVNFKFWSDSPYTITLEERTNEENDIKYTELDLTGKYGVGFIPKIQTIELYEEFYGIFKIPMQNNYKLLFYKDYNLIKNNNKSNLLEDKVLLSLEKFEYLFTKENKNSYLLFVNNNFENGTNASIYYNSNYFNYCILDESISSCNIINPNTNEETNINTNLSDVDSFKIANVFDTFLSFSNSTNFILENVTHFYNDYLPSELKAFFYISFGFVVIIIITKIVL